jgi:hypothetical protein
MKRKWRSSAPAASTPPPARKTDTKQELDADGNPIARDDDEDEDEQANMSLAAMEAALKPRVLETPRPHRRRLHPCSRTCRTSA